jgi:O-antigen ligase
VDVSDVGFVLLKGLFVSLPFGVALLLGISLPLVIVGASSVTGKLSPNARALVIIGAVVLGSALSVAFSGRTLQSEAEAYRSAALSSSPLTASTLGVRLSQFFTLIALLFATCEIYRCLTGKFSIFSTVSKLWWALLLFNGISIGLSGIFGEFREMEFRFLYFFILASGLLALSKNLDANLWKSIRWLLVVPSAGSLICILLAPQLVLLNDYESFIPGLTSRLFGLSEHANGIGLLAVIAIALECSPIVRSRPSLLILLHLTVLILSQSKTAWVALFIVLPLVRWHWLTSGSAAQSSWNRKAWLLLSMIFAALVVSLLGVLAASSDTVQRVMESKSVYTLTGRVRIWEITLQEFYRSPILGYGPSIWDMQFRMAQGLPFVGQAHNQFVHILGQSGILGFASMILYLVVLGLIAIRARIGDQGLSMGLFALLLFRCLTESPLRMVGIMSWESLLQLLLLTSAACYGIRSSNVTVAMDMRPFKSRFASFRVRRLHKV